MIEQKGIFGPLLDLLSVRSTIIEFWTNLDYSYACVLFLTRN